MHELAQTIVFCGVDTIPEDAQLHIVDGLTTTAINGLADKAVGESRERVWMAKSLIGLALSPKRIVVNFAPAYLVRKVAHFDLPIALDLLMAFGVVLHAPISD